MISACLEEHIDIVPLVTFTSIFLSEVVMITLKLCIYPDRNQISSETQPNIVETGKSKETYFRQE